MEVTRRVLVVWVAGAFMITGMAARAISGDTRNARAHMAIERAAHTSTLLADGKVLLAGGFRATTSSSGRTYESSAELYDPRTGKTTPTGEMTFPRSGHIAVRLDDGMVLVAGGIGPTGPLSSAELYNPSNGTFSPLPPMAGRRVGGTAVKLRDGRVLVLGGTDEHDPVAFVELFDPTTRTFATAAGLKIPRNFPAALLLQSGTVLVTGGSSRRDFPLAAVEIYEPAKNIFRETGSMLEGRTKHGAAILPGGDVLVFGGTDDQDWRQQMTSVERFTPSTGGFAACPPMNHGHSKMGNAVVVLADQSVLVAGGNAIIERYRPAQLTWTDAGSLGPACYYVTATLLNDGSVLIAGGYDERVKTTNRILRWRP
jgi:hypothetical protein